MITKIVLNEATYINHEYIPKKINYLFGSNGTGKSTLTRVIANPESYPRSSVNWTANLALPTYVYNKEFVESHFGQDSIKGIFTLGRNVPEIEEEIRQLTIRLKANETQIDSFNVQITEKERIKAEHEAFVIDKNWAIKIKYEKDFKRCLSGVLDSKKKFSDKIIQQISLNQSVLLSYEELVSKYNVLFQADPEPFSNISIFSPDSIMEFERDNKLAEPISSASESPFADLVKRIGNIDWVKLGLDYHKVVGNHICPFCQQSMTEDLEKEIKELFNENYKEKVWRFLRDKQEYIRLCVEILTLAKQGFARIFPGFNNDVLRDAAAKFELIFEKNLNLIEKKEREQNIEIQLTPLSTLAREIFDNLQLIRGLIVETNALIEHLDANRAILITQVWRFVSNEANIGIASDLVMIGNCEKAIAGIFSKKEKLQVDNVVLINEIREKEGSRRSIEFSVTEINKILTGLNFNGFKLAPSETPGYYRIVRPDGSNAKATLSEGEKTFITFLYFYHLLNGSTDSQAIETRRVVSIDDPISSLDSNILFVISSLVKRIIRATLDSTGNIVQVFISTHNVYFQKEISYKGLRNSPTRDEQFSIIRKHREQSTIQSFSENQIHTSYELLWKELRNPSQTNSITIFNTLRRILEYYFKIIGSCDYEKKIEDFELEDRQVAQSLIGWINDGSHFVNDDLHIESEFETVDRYLIVFENLFDKLGHKSHYNMMMGIE